MNFKFEADEIRALAKVYERGHISRGFKPVHWCFDCGSALAEAEIEYHDKQSPAIDVAYDAVESENDRVQVRRYVEGRRYRRRSDLDDHAMDVAGEYGRLARHPIWNIRSSRGHRAASIGSIS